jgi:hypothetical protein
VKIAKSEGEMEGHPPPPRPRRIKEGKRRAAGNISGIFRKFHGLSPCFPAAFSGFLSASRPDQSVTAFYTTNIMNDIPLFARTQFLKAVIAFFVLCKYFYQPTLVLNLTGFMNHGKFPAGKK